MNSSDTYILEGLSHFWGYFLSLMRSFWE